MALIYLSHPIGDGGTLSEIEKIANKKRAFKFVNRLREMFPNIKFFCPAEVEVFVSKALEKRSDCCNSTISRRDEEIPERTGLMCNKCKKDCWHQSFLNLDQVLAIDCEIIKECEGLIAYTPGGKTSKGMDTEIEFALKNNIPTLNLWYGDDINNDKLMNLVETFIIECIDG